MEPEWMRRLPPDVLASTKELVRVSRQMLHETGREAFPEELAERLGSPIGQVRRWLKIAKEGIDPGEDAANL
jgi:RNA polymerase primary sigma factor